jgi:hypothetical protein
MLVAHPCNSSYLGGRDQEDFSLKQPSPVVHKTLSYKNTTQERAGGVTQVVEQLPSKYGTLNSSYNAANIYR